MNLSTPCWSILTIVTLVLIGVLIAGCGGTTTELPTASATSPLPDAPRAAFKIPKPTSLKDTVDLTWWAPVVAATSARRSPDSDSAVVAKVRQLTAEGTANLVVVVGRSRSRGAKWLKVRLATLPRNRTGWVPKTALGPLETVSTHLVVDLRKHVATLYDEGREIFKAPVGVGRAATPTPSGEFYVRDKLTKFHSPTYGPVAFGTSARSAVLTEWPAGGFVGLHGTDEPQILPGAVSHGCVRFTDPDIRRLARLMPVGTPLTIR